MRALVVEDDVPTTGLIRGILADLGRVDVAHTGAEARALAAQHTYDLLLLDLVLPDVSGLDLLRELRDGGHGAPVLVLTGRSDSDSMVQLLDAGADDYVVKPVENDVLRARVRALLRRAGQAGDTMVFGALEVDRVAHRIRIGGAELPLTPKEYGLLHHFLMRTGQVVPRAELLAHVWGMRFDPGSNLVDVSVARVRRKLERYPDAPRIDTVRGVGFVLVAAEPDDVDAATA